MKQASLFVVILLMGLVGFGQNQKHFFIKYRAQDSTIYYNIQSVNGIHIDVNGHELTCEDGSVFTPLTDMDTVYIYSVLANEWVDLGLPSGLLWATCNVGANAPEDFGDYFAWAETNPKFWYNWETYRYCCDIFGPYLSKYCEDLEYNCNGIDNLTLLQSEDDAATVNWGSDARIPAIGEWIELYSHCSVDWTTLNGVKGLHFTGSNGNSIFLPAAGYLNGNEFNENCGNYWSNSRTIHQRNAWYFGFYYDVGAYSMLNDGYRSGGRSVRAVRSAK